LRGQRRRGPPKRAPKNVFSRGATKEPKKVQSTPIPKPSPPKSITTPPKAAGSVPKAKPEKEKKVKIVEKIVEEVVIEEKIIPKEIVPDKNTTKEIISEQILGIKPNKSRGLKQIKKKETVVKDTNVQSDRAAALIEQSRKRAMVPVPKPIVKEKVVKPAPRRRRAPKSSYQPANRAKRLNRSRHMEYKYEMRKLLQDINVSEEHRSNLLGTIWAKGERQTASDAKLFLDEKLGEGAINEEQKSQLEKVIDSYTIRR
tara:strand:+ start:2929 stop:3699 length:771 start_codon:yes stop_codon:yes gene_type:complete